MAAVIGYALIIAAVVALVSFLIGSIPFGYIIGRFFYRTDIRKSGSGNIGAMNALRTLGKTGAVAVLLLDAAKGVLPALAALHFIGGTTSFSASGPVMPTNEVFASIAATFSVLGHCFSPWLGWKGGKGVATAFGAIFALSWPAGLAVIAGWIVGALVFTRYSSVGSMLANIVAPFALFYFTRSIPETIFGAFVAVFIIYTHRENLERLRSGSENPISLFSKKPS